MRRAVILLAMMGARLAAQPASIEGTVVDQITGEPLERVHIRLALDSQDRTEVYGAISDSVGHFSVAKMSPGRYWMLAERTGYAQAADSHRQTLKAGQELTDLKVKMEPASMLIGRVVDQYGDPVAGLNVQIMPVPPTVSSPSLIESHYSLTDDRGDFRILAGPGKYYLEVMILRSGVSGPPEVRTDGTSETIYGPTYYPGSPTKGRAAVVEVTAGHDVDGLEIRLAAAASLRPLSISGTVAGIPAGAWAMATLMPTGSVAEQMGLTWINVHPDGKFLVSGLPPDTYELTAQSNGTKKPLMGRVQVTLEAADTAVVVPLSEAGDLTGALEMAGAPASSVPAEKLTVHLEPVRRTFFYGNAALSGDVVAGGSFHVAGAWPGKFRVTVDPLPEAAYLKTVEMDGAAVADGEIEVVGGRVSRLKITVGLDGASISGKVRNQDGEPSEGGAVYLFADSKEVKQTARIGRGTARIP